MAIPWKLIALMSVGTGVTVLALAERASAKKRLPIKLYSLAKPTKPPPLTYLDKKRFLYEIEGSKFSAFAPYYDIAEEASIKYNIPVPLIAGLMFQESSYNPKIVSPVGAIGLTQVMPPTGMEQCRDIISKPEDLYNPRKNVLCGMKYLRRLHNRFKDWNKALGAYWGGPGNVGQPKANLYAHKVLTHYKNIKNITGA